MMRAHIKLNDLWLLLLLINDVGMLCFADKYNGNYLRSLMSDISWETLSLAICDLFYLKKIRNA